MCPSPNSLMSFDTAYHPLNKHCHMSYPFRNILKLNQTPGPLSQRTPPLRGPRCCPSLRRARASHIQGQGQGQMIRLQSTPQRLGFGPRQTPHTKSPDPTAGGGSGQTVRWAVTARPEQLSSAGSMAWSPLHRAHTKGGSWSCASCCSVMS